MVTEKLKDLRILILNARLAQLCERPVKVFRSQNSSVKQPIEGERETFAVIECVHAFLGRFNFPLETRDVNTSCLPEDD